MADFYIRLHLETIDKTSGKLKVVSKSLEQASERFGALKRAGEVAAGMLIRDFVQGLTASIEKSMDLGAQVGTLENAFNRLIKTTGGTEISLEKLRKATRGTVSDVDLLKSANQAMMLGLPTDELDELMASAMKLGHAMGIDTTKAVESLTTGVGRQSKLILDNLGVVFQASDAYKWYAKQLGVTSNQLTEAQKKEGWQAYAIMQITEKADELGDIMDETQLSQERWNASMTNTQTSIGRAIGPLRGLVGAMQPLLPMLSTMGGVLLPDLIKQLPKTGIRVLDLVKNVNTMGISWTSAALSVAGFSATLMGGIMLLKALPADIRNVAAALMAGVGAVVAATVAWLAFHTTMSIGTLAPVILAAVGAAVAGLTALLAPHVIGLAEGGIVTRPTLAVLGERGPEAVIPLHGGAPAFYSSIHFHEVHIHNEADENRLARKIVEIQKNESRAMWR